MASKFSLCSLKIQKQISFNLDFRCGTGKLKLLIPCFAEISNDSSGIFFEISVLNSSIALKFLSVLNSIVTSLASSLKEMSISLLKAKP